MSNEFMREERYIVFKMSDLGNSLKGDEIRRLAREYAEQRRLKGKKPLECVVVEKDWPEYEPTWRAIEARMAALSAQSIKDAIIDDLQSQFDSDGITEHDSGDALIRLSDAIAAVEDNFVLAQPAPSVPDISNDMIEAIESRAEQSYRRHHSGIRGQQITPADALSWHIIHATRSVLAAAPEAKS